MKKLLLFLIVVNQMLFTSCNSSDGIVVDENQTSLNLMSNRSSILDNITAKTSPYKLFTSESGKEFRGKYLTKFKKLKTSITITKLTDNQRKLILSNRYYFECYDNDPTISSSNRIGSFKPKVINRGKDIKLSGEIEAYSSSMLDYKSYWLVAREEKKLIWGKLWIVEDPSKWEFLF